MNKDDPSLDDMRPEYDFSRMKDGVRGKYLDRYRSGTNLVKIDPDVARFFADDHSVNDALRTFIKVAHDKVRPAK